jgi:hypothetical protein
MRLFANANYDFLSRRRKAYVLSAAVIGLFLAGALFWQVRAGSWANYGVDFAGGTLVQVEFQEPSDVTISDVRATIGQILPDAQVTRFGGANDFGVGSAIAVFIFVLVIRHLPKANDERLWLADFVIGAYMDAELRGATEPWEIISTAQCIDVRIEP